MIVGVLGAGQLGKMLALAGYPLGLKFRFLDPSPDSPAAALAPCVTADYSDEAALERFAADVDCITYEFENVPLAAAHFLAARTTVFPPPKALETAQDRLAEKRLFTQLSIPTTRFAVVDDRSDLTNATREIGLPAVLKRRRMGYDGKGQAVIRSEAEAEAAWLELGGAPLILEEFVKFDREVSLISVRGACGRRLSYPLSQNRHENGILRVS
ncbi:MAG TPA: ATP-grasp domain-containing protein, partial [Chthonomonadales bacterium]|nr:ATP-grasp domain-containing protein [Chthonomonadales bacterium]